jgi:uncharacterized protein (DUF58 family)
MAKTHKSLRSASPEGAKRLFHITRQGWYFLALTLGVGLAALRTGNNLLFLVLGMMLGMVLLSGLLAELSLRKLSLKRFSPPELRSCKPFLMHVSIKNEKKRMPSFSIEVEDILEGQLMDKRCYFLKIPAGRTQKTSYRHAFPRRGRYRFIGFKVSTKFPFGLLRKSLIFENRGEVLVYPAPRKTALPATAAAELRGARFRRRLQRMGEPYGLREYRPGDDMRLVHHKASAHLNRLVIREHEESGARRAVIYIDNGLLLKSNEGYLSAAEALEAAISETTYLATDFLDRAIAVSLISRSGVIPFGTGKNHLAAVLRFLALLEYDDGDAPLQFRHHSFSDVVLLANRNGVSLLDRRGDATAPEKQTRAAEAHR